jgi:hypothetical protein
VEEAAGLGLLHPLVAHDVVEQLAPRRVLHYQVQLLRSLDYLTQ